MKSKSTRKPFFLAVLIAISLISFVSGPGRAQDKDAPFKKIVSIEGITEYRLNSNGVPFLLFPDPSASTVTINMTVLVGSRHEGYGETGMAHLLEHMLFKGCKAFPDVNSALIAHGASESNATTWTDRTNYFETMPATDKNLEFGIQLEADRLVNSFIRREDLIKEMTVVRNEFEQGENSPDMILNQRMMAIAYEWHNYGKSTIGNRSDIERVPIERLHEFYKKFYQPDNIIVIVAGKFDQAKAKAYLVKYFGALKTPSRRLADTYTEEPAQDGERTVTLRRVGKVAVTGTMYHIPSAAHEDHAAMEVLSSILGDTPSGRLYKALVETKKATKIDSSATAWHDPGILESTAHVADKTTNEEVRDIMLDVVEKFAGRPATKEEVDRAVQRYLSDREQTLTKSKKIALELSEWAAAGDWRLLFIHRDRVAKVTPADVNKVAAKYLRQSNRTVGMFIPTTEVARTPVPANPDVEALVKDYKGGKSLSQGELFETTPENIEKRVKRLTLPSGVKAALLAKKTRGDAVIGTMVLHFGNEKSLLGNTTATNFIGSLMMRGTEKHDRQEIQDILDKLNSSLNGGSSPGSLTFSWQSKREQLPAVLDLLREVLREPTFPEKEFDILKRNQKQALEKALTDPQAARVPHPDAQAQSLSQGPYPVQSDDPGGTRTPGKDDRGRRRPDLQGADRRHVRRNRAGRRFRCRQNDKPTEGTVHRLASKSSLPAHRPCRQHQGAGIHGKHQRPRQGRGHLYHRLDLPLHGHRARLRRPGTRQLYPGRQLHIATLEQATGKGGPVLRRPIGRRCRFQGSLYRVLHLCHLQPR